MILKLYIVEVTSYRYGEENSTILKRFFNEDDRDAEFLEVWKSYDENPDLHQDKDDTFTFKDSINKWAYTIRKAVEELEIIGEIPEEFKVYVPYESNICD